ncbi:site-specific integrase [Patescibacteria group bacterium]|nr:site-specific integrase [Patescibacteria group bacterium]
MVLPRCLNLFYQALGSKITHENYKWQLDRFMAWNKITDYDDLLKADEKSIQRNLEDYLIHIKDRNSPNYIPSIMAPVELFYLMNEKNLNTKRLHKMFPTKTKRSGYGSYTREHIQSMIDNTNKRRTKALILFLASSGCRVGVIPELKLRHITDIENCKQVLCYAESKEEYTAFMTPEASKAFDDYLEERQQDKEKLKPESPAFRKTYVLGSFPADTMETGTVRNAISITLKDVSKIKTGTRFNIPILHGLRKYFNVALKSRHNCNLSLCEKMMGHSVSIPLDNHYGTFSNEAIFEEYKKAIPELSISKEWQLKEELKRNKEETRTSKDMVSDELRSIKEDNAEMKERFTALEDMLKRLSEKD